MATGISKTQQKQVRPLVKPPQTTETGTVTLTYVGKRAEQDILDIPPASVVQVWPAPDAYMTHQVNRLLYGDNLTLLAKLRRDPQVCGRVRLVYIDPPYATQSVFQSRNQADAYADLLSGAHYLEFMRERLILLRELLADDGSIYVHLDENMAFYIKVIMDEVFGAENFRSWITRKKCNPKNYTRKTYGNISDYILFYTKTDDYVWHRAVEGWTPERAAKEYQYIEAQTGRRYKKVPVHAPGVRHGATGKVWHGMSPPPGKHWQYTPDKLDEMDARGEIYWSPNGNPRRKVYLDDSTGVPVQDIWLEFRDAHNQNIAVTGYPTEKNPDLLARIIEASSNPGDLVLDGFCGSGTTLAVASTLGRRWIGIDNSVEAIATTLRRFAIGTQPMGDFVSQRNGSHTSSTQTPVNLSFLDEIAELASPAAPKGHKPIIDFVLWAEKTTAAELALPLQEWNRNIGQAMLEPVVKEASGKYRAKRTGSSDAHAGKAIAHKKARTQRVRKR
jgi:adenine-specific DNA-methyltransferase